MVATTCGNSDCEKHSTCQVNIWTDETPSCYMSKRQAIYYRYVKKCEKNGAEPMSYNIYFEDAFRD
jgi:hypothetical protein